jgi:hypothetical protein
VAYAALIPEPSFKKIMAYLESNGVVLPNGGKLTPQRWQQLGTDSGMTGKSSKH